MKLEQKNMSNEYLEKAMNFKNSDAETLKYFEDISDKKQQISSKMHELGYFEKIDIVQQKRADLKTVSQKYMTMYKEFADTMLNNLKRGENNAC
ncbi:hypothetical protein [Mycoplasma struthionis]|nr:hypothetical protein [Mycoplasma struthionis]TPI02519.1 hypothetical protein FJM01_00495 [Mycoplasma struthionis]